MIVDDHHHRIQDLDLDLDQEIVDQDLLMIIIELVGDHDPHRRHTCVVIVVIPDHLTEDQASTDHRPQCQAGMHFHVKKQIAKNPAFLRKKVNGRQYSKK